MNKKSTNATGRQANVSPLLLGTLAFGLLAASSAALAQAPKDGRIGYVLTKRVWAIHESERGEVECPQGFNTGPREEYAMLFPEDSGKTYTELETRLMREGLAFHTTDETPLPFFDAQGPTAYGLNLDGEVGPEDFTNPEGEEGVDNQMYRAMGCINAYRTDGVIWFFATDDMYRNAYNRWLIELTNVDDLSNDDDVTVTTYRGLDELTRDGTGTAFIAGATQQVDTRWGQRFIEQFKGKIVDGVLTTDPVESITIPWSQPGVSTGVYVVRDLQLRLDLTDKTADGLWAGYLDVNSFSHQLNTNWATHHQSYGQLSASSLHRAARRLADAYPDPETGKNTAISTAVHVSFVQAHIDHPDDDTRVAGLEAPR